MTTAQFIIGQKVFVKGLYLHLKITAITPDGKIVCENKKGVKGTFTAEELTAV